MGMNRPALRKNEAGQAVIEYIMLVSILATIFLGVQAALDRLGLAKKLMSPIQKDYAMAYQFGHPQAKGFDNGGPSKHIRVVGGEGNFRLFLNPGAQ